MKILLISLSGIGNTIIFTPTMKLIKEHLPDSEVTVLILNKTFEDLIDTSPYVDKIVSFDDAKSAIARVRLVLSLRREKYDVSLIAFPSNRIQYNVLSYLIGANRRITHSYPVGFIRTLAFLQNERVPAIYGIHDVQQNINLLKQMGLTNINNTHPEIFLTDKEIQFAKEFLHNSGISLTDLIIGIHPGSSKGLSAKRWPEERFAKVIEHMVTKHSNAKVILFGGPDELDAVRNIHSVCKAKPVIATGNTIKQTAAIIKGCTLLLNVDSGLGHIASCLNIPTVTIFGPANPKRVTPYGDKSYVIKSNHPCSPCYQYPFHQTNDKIHCSTMECMKQIDEEMVIRAVEEQINTFSTQNRKPKKTPHDP